MTRSRPFVLAASVVLAAGTCAMASMAYGAREEQHESSEAKSHEHESSAHENTGLTPGVPHPVTLSNQGATALEVEIRFLGKDPRDFTQTNNCGERLKAQGSCVINVTFAPRAPGARSATMEIHTSGGTKYVYLTGTGV